MAVLPLFSSRQRFTAAAPSNPVENAGADHELALRCRAGDERAFEELYRRHATRIFNLARRMTRSPQEAEDLLQEVFLQVYRKIGGFRGESSFGTWLYRVAVNVSLDYLRSRQGRMAKDSEPLDDEAAPVPVGEATLGIVGRIDLERAVARLPSASRVAFLLHDVEGFEHHEVAAILGIAEGTSKSQVHKARLKLRALLAGTRLRAR